MASKAIVGGLGVAVGLVAGYLVTSSIGGKGPSEDTNVVLGPGNSGGNCDVISKENVLTRAPGKKIKWWVRDFQCGRDEVLVTVGNFRTTEQSNNPDCANATEGGTVWPFSDSEDVQYRRARRNNKIELKLKDQGLSSLYYFDVCSGSDKQVKADPRLVIDPNF